MLGKVYNENEYRITTTLTCFRRSWMKIIKKTKYLTLRKQSSWDKFVKNVLVLNIFLKYFIFQTILHYFKVINLQSRTNNRRANEI